jgi:RNA polymerase sigma-70 factor (ECF subfamily)
MPAVMALRRPMVPLSVVPAREDEGEQRAGDRAPALQTGVQSFEDGLLRHLPALQRAALRLTRHPQEAEDLVQETMARALTYRGQFHSGTNLRAWLLTIERSIFLSAYRRERQMPRLQSMDDVDESTLYGAGERWASPSAEHVLVHVRMDEGIVAALRALPPHYRQAVLLCDVQGLSYAETAQQLGCALGTVMSRLHRGRALLRAALGGPDPDTTLPAAAARAIAA